VPDNYEAYYIEKLWGLLPSIYRAEDTDELDRDSHGPLRELVERIGVQAAIVRRSLDRLWEDQSIETCDDWLIPYIGDLLATNLVASLDARGQRLDVAKTIYYRRRKGTIVMLEELAADITGWSVRVVEFFLRLGRTRHGLDPALGYPADTVDPLGARRLQLAQRLVGPLTSTGIGGLADLRHPYGALKAHTAFDEFFHTADLRRGQEQVGWYNIPRVGVFLWRLRSYGLEESTPVAVQNCPGHYTFDPTGRQRPLFADGARAYGDDWISPEEWQLPTPISTALLELELDHLYATATSANSLAVYRRPGAFSDLVPASQVVVYPEIGRLKLAPALQADPIRVRYHYGFSSDIGAGPYERRFLKQPLTPMPGPPASVSGGGNALEGVLNGLGATGTITIGDSLTYTSVGNVGGANPVQQVTLRGDTEKETRPVVRLPAPAPGVTEWVFQGAAGGDLVLEGLLISGGDLVLRGDFASVILRCCTLDPGDAGLAPAVFATAVDGRHLLPCRVWVEGQVQELVLDRCIAGPVRTRHNGAIGSLTANDSIVQAIRTAGFGALIEADFKDATRLAARLRDAADPLSQFIKAQLPAATQAALNTYDSSNSPAAALQTQIATGLNVLLAGPSLYTAARFAHVSLNAEVQALIAQNPLGADLARLNRLLIEAAYPVELADLTIATSAGEVDLVRCTLLGPAHLHRLTASECILDDIVLVEDPQHGCVRFSAWARGSKLPRQYESVEVAPRAPLFVSRVFAQPGYAQLLSSVDRTIRSGAAGATISTGASNGAEMGAFAREKNLIKANSLRIKYEEFMPLGLVPVLIYVT
jgi:hypothetical protein